MQKVKTKQVLMVLCLMMLMSFGASAKTGKEVLDDIKNAYGDFQSQVVTMKIQTYDKGKLINDREVLLLTKNQNNVEKSLLKFNSPKDVAGVGLLDQGDGVMYLYLPEFHKEKRIAGSAKNGSFMGTDFTYTDLSLINYDSSEYSSELIKETKEIYELELKEKDQANANYAKLIMTVRKSDLFPTSVSFYNKDGKVEKVLTSYDVKSYGKYKYPQKLQMENKLTNHKTVILLKEPEFDKDLNDSLFTVRTLQKTKIRY